MLAATDAVAVAAILKGGEQLYQRRPAARPRGAPEWLAVLLEGESLFNDASSIVLFEIFLKLSSRGGGGGGGGGRGGEGALLELLGAMVADISQLAAVGVVMGMLIGYGTKFLFKHIQRRGTPPHAEVAITLGGAYLTYLLTEYYGLFGFHGSGVIGVVVYGLFGSATLIFGLSRKGRRHNAFFDFWDVVQFTANGLVFFFVGASVVNFFVRIAPELYPDHDDPWDYAWDASTMMLTRVAPISLFTLLIRGGLMFLEAPLLALVGGGGAHGRGACVGVCG
ncbi:hypothetical protein MNEG_5523 [Monoraphidium neglectum]|uniref:Cation/H+ exchanger transmembrane domain-containing protein n=1 Tax=Monoraphidium neglectum TaxID=145388 RepID=A0A0D2L620_9CHLO|nr:hypothetical protein MNEG_5523 [Monoraphidium neglectum]KIZ02439.1 hypothetical protein MNEG_5523 [Monoraphidium neglectum]|eukprot:XP_013901458.1 hypothetical protein MNEG_5523 [Monoraphidium neglectum]